MRRVLSDINLQLPRVAYLVLGSIRAMAGAQFLGEYRFLEKRRFAERASPIDTILIARF